MLKKDNSPRSIRIRISGVLSLFFLISFIITLIITIATRTTSEGKTEYNTVCLSINFLSFSFFIVFSILFFIFFFYRFAKRTNGPSLPMTPKENFEDEFEEGKLFETISPKSIDYQTCFVISFVKHFKELISLSLITALSLSLFIYNFFTPLLDGTKYALYVLSGISFLLILVTAFIIPVFVRKNFEKSQKAELQIYQDKILLHKEKEDYLDLYYSAAFKAIETKKGYYFLFQYYGEHEIFLLKDEVQNDTKKLLTIKVKQIRNNK